MLSHLRLYGINLAFLIGFNVERLADGLKSYVVRAFVLFMSFHVVKRAV